MARKRRNQSEESTTTRRSRYDNPLLTDRSGVGYSQPALEALSRGNYDELTNRKAQYNTSQEQTQQAKSLPVLKGVSVPKSEEFQSSFGRNTDKASKLTDDSFEQYDTDMKKAEFIARTNGQTMPEMQEAMKQIPSYTMMPEKERREFYKQSKSQKPSSKYQNNVIADSVKTKKESTRDKSFDNDFDEFYDYRAGDLLNVVDYDPVKDADVEHWRNLKTDLMKKHKWSEQEFDKRWNEYLDERNQATADEEVKRGLDIAKKHPILGTGLQAIYTPQTWIEGGASMVEGGIAGLNKALGTNYLEDYIPKSADSPMFTGTRTKEGIKQEVRDNHIKTGIGKNLYEAGTGLGDMALSMGLPGGSVGTGFQKAANKQMQALERGIDPNKAAETAALQGLNGIIMGKYGLDKMFGAKGKTLGRTILKAGGREGLENVAEDLVDMGIDALINGDQSEINELHDYYVSQGGDEDAWNKVLRDKGKELATSFESGFATGGVFSTLQHIPEIGDYIKTKQNRSLGAMDKDFARFISDRLDGDSININGTDYSIDKANSNLIDANGKEVPIIDPTVFDTSKRGTAEQTKRQFAAQLTKYIKDNFVGKTFTVKDNGRNIGFIGESADEFAGSNSSYRKNNEKMGLKANIAPRLQSVIENALFNHHEPNMKSYTPMKERGMDKYDITIAYPTKDGIELYDAVMDVGLHQDGNDYFFDILEIEPKKKADTQLLSNDSVTDISRPSFDNNVNQNGENVNSTGRLREIDDNLARIDEKLNQYGESNTNDSEIESIKAEIRAYDQQIKDIEENGIHIDINGQDTRLDARSEQARLIELRVLREQARNRLEEASAMPVEDALADNVRRQLEQTRERLLQEREGLLGNRGKDDNNITPPQIPPTNPPINNGGNVPPTNPPGDSGGGNVPPSNNGGGNVPPNTPINLTQDANGNVAESGTSKHIRAVDTPMKYNVADELAADFVKDPQMYARLKNADTQALSDAIYDSGDAPVSINGRTYEGTPEQKFRTLLSEKNPASLPLGKRIADDYSAQGNHDLAAQVYRDMGSALTEAGQFTQASAISMMKNDPLSALAYMEKEIDALNKAGAEKYGKKWKNFELTDEERAQFNDIKPGDEQAIKAAYDKVGARIEQEYPASAWEKVLEFRRVAMLFNTRTLGRNFLANPPTAGLRYISDRIEGVGQYVAHLINPDFEITQSVRGSNSKTRKAAIQVFNSDKVQKMLKNTPGRMSEVPKIGDYAKSKQIFKGGIVSDFINKLTDNGIEKLNAKLGKQNAKSILELGRNATYGALEVTDNPFVRENFISRLGSYMRAKGITNPADVSDDAINIALEEALKATYKDDSWLVQGIRSAKKSIENVGNGIMPGVRLGDMASQALIPYVQAPGNIGARIIDYSPVGATKGIAKIISGAKAGDMKGLAKGIEEFSKGATGSMMAALGMALYRSGILTGTYSTDKDQKAFEKQNGFREFAIKWTSPFDGKTKYETIDWAQPFVDTLMPGVLLAQAIENSDGYDSDILRYFGIEDSALGKGIGIATDTIGKNVNYFFNATPLKNLGELLSSKANGDTDIAGNLWENTVEDFASALVPASVNALAKSVDPIQRQTYNPDNSFGTFINSNAAKVPEVTKTLPVKYNTWGEPMTYGDNKFEAAFAKMFYPGEHTSDNSDAIDNEINRLFTETQNNGVFPQVASYKVDGVPLTDKEVSEYQRTMGQRNRQMAESFINSDAYASLDDKTRADIITNMFNASKAIADYEIKGKEYPNTYKTAGELYASGGPEAVVNNYVSKVISKNAGVSSTSNAAKDIEQAVQSGNIQKAQEIATTTVSAKNAAAEAGVVDKDGNPDVEHYNKVIAAAKDESARMERDLPKLKELGLSNSADYVYANAIQKNPNITIPEFVQTYNEIDTDKGDKLTQKELLAYLNQWQFSDDPDEDIQIASDYWNTYQDGTWKKKLYRKQDGTFGAK